MQIIAALPELHAWMRECGQLARSYFNKAEVTIKADKSYVTNADVEIERVLVERLRNRYPNIGIIGEEGTRLGNDQEYIWAIDPIDGTGSFVSGLATWGISLGLLHNAKPVLGICYMPVTDDLYWNEADKAFWNEHEIQVANPEEWYSEHWISIPSNAHRRYQNHFPAKCRSLGAIISDLCYVARGSSLGALIGRCSLWDLAGALAILEAAGGSYVGLSGQKPKIQDLYSGTILPEPVIAAHPEQLDRLRSYIGLTQVR